MAPVGAGGVDGCRVSPPVPRGTQLCDTRGKGWVVGQKMGAGAFGAIYDCARQGEDLPGEYVVKIEPHDNGPLFVEMHAFLRLCKDEHFVDWKPRAEGKPIGWVGVPRYFASGSFSLKSLDPRHVSKLRFLVMTKLRGDLEKFFKAGAKPFPLATVLNISIQVINSLEYVHSRGYCHNDIKAQNLLIDSSGCDIYLVDFGLACKFQDRHGFHRSGVPDERRAHDGTLEYTSRDAHKGAHSRRGDLETLGYNLVHWCTGFLPWKEIEEHEMVEAYKHKYMDNLEEFLSKCFKPNPYPPVLLKYLEIVNGLDFKSKPDYNSLRRLFGCALEELGSCPHARLLFNSKGKGRRSRRSSDVGLISLASLSQGEQGEAGEGVERSTRSKDSGSKVFWQEAVNPDPESIIKSSSRSRMESEAEVDEDPRAEAARLDLEREGLRHPTPEMARMLAERLQMEKEREALGWKDQLDYLTKRKEAIKYKFATMDLTPRHNTPAMEEVTALRTARHLRDSHTPDPSDEEEEATTTTPSQHDRLKLVSFCSPAILPSPAILHSPAVFKAHSSVNPRKIRPPLLQASPDLEDSPLVPRKTRLQASIRTEDSDQMDDSPTNVLVTNLRKTRIHATVQDEADSPLCRRTRQQNNIISDHNDSIEDSCDDISPKSNMKGNSGTPQTLADCIKCGKTLNVKSMARHLREVHKLKGKRPSLDKDRTRSGFTPEIKRGRGRPKESPSATPIVSPLVSTKSLPDSPSKNLRVAACLICGKEMAKSLLPKHFDDYHSPSGVHRSTRSAEDAARSLARVSVCADSTDKIRNFDSPLRPPLPLEEAGNRNKNAFRRVTRSCKSSEKS